MIKEIGSVKKSGKKTNMKKPSGKVSKNMAEKTNMKKPNRKVSKNDGKKKTGKKTKTPPS